MSTHYVVNFYYMLSFIATSCNISIVYLLKLFTFISKESVDQCTKTTDFVIESEKTVQRFLTIF